MSDGNKFVRVLSAQGDVLIWLNGNSYAVAINMETRVQRDIYTDQIAEEFIISVYNMASKIEKNWKLVKLTGDNNEQEKKGRVIGQKQLTFFPEQ